MAAKFLILLSCLALSQGAMVRRDAPAEPSIFETIQKNAVEMHKVFSEQLQGFTSSKNAEDFQKVVKDGSNAVVTQIGSLATALQNAAKDATGKTKEELQKAQANMERFAKELREAHPELEQQVTALKEKMQATVDSTVQESTKLMQEMQKHAAEANEKLAPKLQQGFEEFTKQLQEVGKKVHEAATKQ